MSQLSEGQCTKLLLSLCTAKLFSRFKISAHAVSLKNLLESLLNIWVDLNLITPAAFPCSY